jgi:hypothetical protein
MKILPHNISENTEQQKTGTARRTTGNEFRDILQETVTTASKPEERTMTLPPVQNIPSMSFDQIQNGDTTRSIQRIEGFLDLLEAYQNKLGDVDSTLKDFSPLVSSMASETEKIMPLLDSLADGDGLKDILNRAVVTATVETIKFNRGDYL